MNKSSYLIALIFFIISCKNINKSTTVKYKTEYNRKIGKIGKLRFSMKIPSNHTVLSYYAGGEWNAKEYWYKDSSVIYITSEKGIHTLNYENLTKNEENFMKRFLSKDTLTFSDTTQNGKFWKDVKLEHISIGYTNVPKEKKELFDKALKSLKKL